MKEHLVQTTLFAIAIFLITFFFRNNAAKVRHLLWLTASVKFLIPFTLLAAIGSQIPWRMDSSPQAATAILRLGHSTGKPIHNPKGPLRVPPVRRIALGVLLWAAGSITVLTARLTRVRRIAAMVRDAEPFQQGGELDIRACDKAVVLSGADPQTYAQGILNVCKLYVRAPAVCLQGVTGANLTQRIKQIMNPHLPSKLSPTKRLLLALMALVTLAGPVGVGLTEAPALHAQDQPQHYSFEVASVKPNASADQRNMRVESLPSGRFVMQGIPLLIIVSYAYDIPFQSPRLSGGSEWQKARGDVYDIEATAPKDAFSPGMTQKDRDARVRLMLQTLLAERFKMKVRIDSKEQPVYVLVVGPGGPKLKASKVQEKDCDASSKDPQQMCHHISGGIGRGIHGSAISVADVALMVQNWSDKPVVDKTGLTGLYDIQTDGWAPMRPRPMGPDGTTPTGGDAGIYDPDRQTLFDVFRQLGLKMDQQRAVIDMYVVDHVDKATAN